jgi:hypothetical protein
MVGFLHIYLSVSQFIIVSFTSEVIVTLTEPAVNIYREPNLSSYPNKRAPMPAVGIKYYVYTILCGLCTSHHITLMNINPV